MHIVGHECLVSVNMVVSELAVIVGYCFVCTN